MGVIGCIRHLMRIRVTSLRLPESEGRGHSRRIGKGDSRLSGARTPAAAGYAVIDFWS